MSLAISISESSWRYDKHSKLTQRYKVGIALNTLNPCDIAENFIPLLLLPLTKHAMVD